MIETVLKIRGIGLLHDAIEQQINFDRVTAIYGENGRGKSTLAALFTSLSGDNAALLSGRKTIGGSHQPGVALKIGGKFHEFDGARWNSSCPDICVFDSAFVDANVYSGFTVTSDHRRQLLDFALGEKGVQLKLKVDELTRTISTTVTSNIHIQEAKISGICRPLTIQQYIAIKSDPDVAKKIVEAEKAVEIASKAKEISAKSKLAEVSIPQMEISSLADLLSKSLSDISEEVKKKVTDHFNIHMKSHGEQWLKEGLTLIKTKHCPFCGQLLEPAHGLLDAYNAYFDQTYKNHLEELSTIRLTINSGLSDANRANLNRILGDNGTTGEFWKRLVSVPIPELPADEVAEKTRNARTKLLTLIDAKIANPMTPISDRADIEKAKTWLGEINQLVAEYNEKVRQVNVAIETIQKQAKSSDLNIAKTTVDLLKRQKERHESPNKDDCERFIDLGKQKKKLEEAKAKARQNLEQFTETLLSKYEKTINSYLECFGAGFRLVDIGTSHEKGLPRVDYKVQIGSHKIAVSSKEQATTVPVFANTLSDGDKRTLAFSFFLAKLDVDGNLLQQIVILDDPVSSLDQSRSRATHRSLRTLAGNAKQLILLSHDPLFIQSFTEDDYVRKLGATVIELKRSGLNYAVLDLCNIEERVLSDYKINYRTLNKYVTEGEVVDRQKVVRAIRPMLEANLRHRFQDSLKGAYSLGKMIEAIRTCKPGSPLERIKGNIEDLEDINNFATDFTHDAEADGSLQQLDDAQLKNYAERALAIARGT